MGDVSIVVNGKEYLGWKDVQITRGLDALCGSFNLSYIDAWEFERLDGPRKTPATTFDKWYLVPGDAVEIYLDRDLVITGYIDGVDVSMSDNDRNFKVSGRDKTADLVDGAASSLNFTTLQNYTLLQAASNLLSPYGIQVVNNTEIGKKFNTVSIEHGQSVFNVLDGMAKQRGILLTTNEKGQLVLTKAADKKAKVQLVEGDNIKRASLQWDFRRRFSTYYVYGQGPAKISLQGKVTNKANSSAKDDAITRYRPRVVIAERAATSDETLKQAQWEAKNAAAKSTQVNVTVNNWRQGEGTVKNDFVGPSNPLWEINALVQVFAPSISVDGEMLIERVEFKLDEDGGEITELSLVRPDAWVAQPIVKEEAKQFMHVDFSGR